MTAPTITQADRDAAVKWAYAEDSESAMQVAFAAHREAEAARIVAIIKRASTEAAEKFNVATHAESKRNFAAAYVACCELVRAIESGEYNLPLAK